MLTYENSLNDIQYDKYWFDFSVIWTMKTANIIFFPKFLPHTGVNCGFH